MHAETACGIDSSSRVRIRPSSCGCLTGVLQLSDSQHVVVRERDERRNGADSECGTIGRVCWTGPMVLDTEFEGIILFLKDTMVDHSRHRRTALLLSLHVVHVSRLLPTVLRGSCASWLFLLVLHVVLLAGGCRLRSARLGVVCCLLCEL